MKNLFNLFYLSAFAATALLSGCGKDDEVKPSPTVTAVVKSGYITTDATVSAGSTVKIAWIANKGDAKLKTFSVTQDGANLTVYNGGVPKSVSGDTYQDSVIFTLPSGAGPYTYQFTVTDADGKTGSFSIKLSIGADIETRTAIIMSGQSNNTGSGQFYSVANKSVYTIAAAKTNAAKVDFAYAHRNTTSGNRMIVSPNSQDATDIYDVSGTDKLSTWSKRNNTSFYTVSSADYTAATSVATINSKLTGTASGTVKELVVGSTFGFKTEDGKVGVAKVTAVAGVLFNDTNNTITLELKVAK